MKYDCVIFGAGKIARGFIGHLLYLSNLSFIFVEKSDELADALNKQGQYTVNILGAPEKNCVVRECRVLRYDQENETAAAIAGAEAVFDAVGGKNLNQIVPLLAKGIEAKAKTGGYLNLVTCENWKKPADVLKQGIEPLLSGPGRKYYEEQVGITEAVIMRSAIEPSEEQKRVDPFTVNVQDYWQLHVDASRLKGDLPPILGLNRIEEFDGFLEKKFYTYNAANGSLSYLGALAGYTVLSEAARDESLLKILDGVYRETSTALCRKYGFTMEEQWAFTRTSLNKLQDRTITDTIERNARDPIRKLGPDDRLVGSARMALSYGVIPENLCMAIAAAIFYTNEQDESAVELENMRKTKGIEYVISHVCKLDPDGTLGRLILASAQDLDKLRRSDRSHTRAVIIGAGRTGRGFVARLLAEAHVPIAFLDRDAGLIRQLQQSENGYRVLFFGGEREPFTISGYKAGTWEDEEYARNILTECELVFVSVGGSHLQEVGEQLKQYLPDERICRVITCENAVGPARTLREAIGKENVLISEAAVFCTTDTAGEGKLDIVSENYPYLPFDSGQLNGYRPLAQSIRPVSGFSDFLKRKIFTYNAASGIISYLGWLKGYRLYAEAANDPEILEKLDRNYAAANRVLCAEFGYDPDDQAEFSLLSRKKFTNRAIEDTIERNAREPLRKLGAEERIIGPIRLLGKYGEDTGVLEQAAAAAILYYERVEEEAVQKKKKLTPRQILREVSHLDDEALTERILNWHRIFAD